ncbi:MAG: hypothetical protein Q8936_19085 [Bacillota bacterium]|nr:hypothetical protein [Bacillota bacterium]
MTLLRYECNDYSKYPKEIKHAYEYVDKQRTIKNWKSANVIDYKASNDLEVFNKSNHKQVNIKGIRTLMVTFHTDDEAELGPIIVFIDKNNKKVLGVGGRR